MAENLLENGRNPLLENGRNAVVGKRPKHFGLLENGRKPVVGKWPKFRPFSYNPKCFGRFPTTVFRPFSNNGFRPFSNKFSAILQLIKQRPIAWTLEVLLQLTLHASRALNLSLQISFWNCKDTKTPSGVFVSGAWSAEAPENYQETTNANFV